MMKERVRGDDVETSSCKGQLGRVGFLHANVRGRRHARQHRRRDVDALDLVEKVCRQTDDKSGAATDVEEAPAEFLPQALENRSDLLTVLHPEVRLALV